MGTGGEPDATENFWQRFLATYRFRRRFGRESWWASFRGAIRAACGDGWIQAERIASYAVSRLIVRGPDAWHPPAASSRGAASGLADAVRWRVADFIEVCLRAIRERGVSNPLILSGRAPSRPVRRPVPQFRRSKAMPYR
jgi:hypothetical protein